jgi:hypothetical protein
MSLYFNKNYGKDLGFIDFFIENCKNFNFTIIELKNMNNDNEIFIEEFIEKQKIKNEWIKIKVLYSIYKDKNGIYWHIEKKIRCLSYEKEPFKVRSYKINKNEIY